jgi:hypothetical protein
VCLRKKERERESALKCESDYLAGIEVFCARARRHIGLTSELCHRLLLFHDHRQKSEKKTFSLVSYFSIFLSSTFGLSDFLFYCVVCMLSALVELTCFIQYERTLDERCERKEI